MSTQSTISPRPSTPPSNGATTIGPATKGAVREAVDEALDLLDRGAARVAEKAPTAPGTSING